MPSFMDLLNETEVNVGAPQLGPFNLDDYDEFADEDDGDEEEGSDVKEIEEGVFEATQAEGKNKRTGNYSEVED